MPLDPAVESTIREALKERPGEAYISLDGSSAYVLLHDDRIAQLLPRSGTNFNDMTDEEVNARITKLFGKIL